VDHLVDRLLRLWTEPVPADDAVAVATFGSLYADPCVLNGTPVPTVDLVARARALQATLDDVHREVLEVVSPPGKLAMAFRIRARHVGAYASSIGAVPATGRLLELRVIDVLTVVDGRITEIVMVADELGLLAGLGAVALVPAPVGGAP
jgi:SnoaL-like polyketide cyclase